MLTENASRIVQRIQRRPILFPEKLSADAQVPAVQCLALYPHSWIEADAIAQFDRIVHFTRNPREMAVSAASYHRKGLESWLHRKPEETDWARWPEAAPYRERHDTEHPDFVKEVLAGRTYFECISSMSMSEAIEFELRMSTGWNIRDMLAFPKLPHVREVNVHEPGFHFMGFWEEAFSDLETHPLALRVMLRQVQRLDRSAASSWAPRRQAHLSRVHSTDVWEPRHERLLETLGLHPGA